MDGALSSKQAACARDPACLTHPSQPWCLSGPANENARASQCHVQSQLPVVQFQTPAWGWEPRLDWEPHTPGTREETRWAALPAGTLPDTRQVRKPPPGEVGSLDPAISSTRGRTSILGGSSFPWTRGSAPVNTLPSQPGRGPMLQLVGAALN